MEMAEDTEYLDDVVVVGYGTQKKSDLTGSIASVDAGDIRNVPARTMAEALQGKVSGVMVSKNDGTPGSGILQDCFRPRCLQDQYRLEGDQLRNAYTYLRVRVEPVFGNGADSRLLVFRPLSG